MGAGKQVRAELEVMGNVSSKFGSHYDQLQAAITTLQNEAEMHSATWSGAAKNAWNDAMVNVNTAWNKLNGVLAEITGNISTSSGSYDNTDTDQAASYRQVPAGDITSALGR
ncbi:MAG: WXG100 family type VII secretion target [Actinocatenispora sp.]